MIARARFTLLMLFSFFTFLDANYLINDHLISPKAADLIEKMGKELSEKTLINGYLIATNDEIKRGVSVYDYLKKYENSLSKPYVAIIFAPNSKRIHLISSNKELLNRLDKGTILDYAIKIIASEDKNSLQSKYDVGLVQAYSEMADEIAKIKNIKLETTIKEGGRTLLNVVNFLIIGGSLIVIWVYFIRPIFNKRK